MPEINIHEIAVRAPAPAPTHQAEQEARDHLDVLLDEALNETFPASDPVAVSPRARHTTSLARGTTRDRKF